MPVLSELLSATGRAANRLRQIRIFRDRVAQQTPDYPGLDARFTCSKRPRSWVSDPAKCLCIET